MLELARVLDIQLLLADIVSALERSVGPWRCSSLSPDLLESLDKIVWQVAPDDALRVQSLAGDLQGAAGASWWRGDTYSRRKKSLEGFEALLASYEERLQGEDAWRPLKTSDSRLRRGNRRSSYKANVSAG